MDQLQLTGQAASAEWVSPGVSLRKRVLTGLGVALASVLFFWIALSQGAPMLLSTLIGIVFIGGFVGYLRVVAPMPFTLRLGSQAIERVPRGGEPITVPWDAVARVKEERFKNGTAISLTVYKRVGERGVHRVFVVYRDDVPRFDALRDALRAALPDGTPWHSETVHE